MYIRYIFSPAGCLILTKLFLQNQQWVWLGVQTRYNLFLIRFTEHFLISFVNSFHCVNPLLILFSLTAFHLVSFKIFGLTICIV